MCLWKGIITLSFLHHEQESSLSLYLSIAAVTIVAVTTIIIIIIIIIIIMIRLHQSRYTTLALSPRSRVIISLMQCIA
ncbi:hypothetical protein CC80DRAFT_316047 [Byssothecium circinans]|uniref:Uncharacterized protein n=1 Tax=Byssothecium circinans TaxID=147558 RepID=A0A6A5T637_9PLEO|nr:hypothetical protein CC80DRAFT_316047 [Byssothecium circinans]